MSRRPAGFGSKRKVKPRGPLGPLGPQFWSIFPFYQRGVFLAQVGSRVREATGASPRGGAAARTPLRLALLKDLKPLGSDEKLHGQRFCPLN